MQEGQEVTILEFLKYLDSNYSQFNGMIEFNPYIFLDLGKSILEENTLPKLDYPLKLTEYLECMEKQDGKK